MYEAISEDFKGQRQRNAYSSSKSFEGLKVTEFNNSRGEIGKLLPLSSKSSRRRSNSSSPHGILVIAQNSRQRIWVIFGAVTRAPAKISLNLRMTLIPVSNSR